MTRTTTDERGRARPRRSGRPIWANLAVAAALAVTTVMAGTGVDPAPAEAMPCRPGTECEPPDPGDPGGGGGGGGGGGTVLTPPVLFVTGRTSTSIDLEWIVPEAATGFRLEQKEGEAWTTLPTSGGVNHRHAGLAPDTRHCYRAVATRLGQPAQTSGTQCAYTKDGRFLRTVWRVELRITTADVANADTEDDVLVRVGGPINGESGGSTWLDHPGDDFERGATRNYDLINLAGISELGDIEAIELYKPGGDAWCVSNVTLLVNDAAVFGTGFGPPCQWLQGSIPLLQIDHDTLHAHPFWQNYMIDIDTILSPNLATLIIGNDQLDGRIESQVGDAIVGTDAYWAPPDAVSVTRWDSQRSKVQIDLKGDVFGDDPHIDIDFDMVVGTHKDNAGNWYVDVTAENASHDIGLSWYQRVLSAASAGAEIGRANRQIESAMRGVAEQVGIGQVYEVRAMFDNHANLVIQATLQCPQTDPVRNTCLEGNHLP